MLASRTLPDGLDLVRTTPTFTADDVPPGLLRAHHLAEGVWGRLRVEAGALVYMEEASGERRTLGPGDVQVIEPEARHHVEPGEGARFHVEMHR